MLTLPEFCVFMVALAVAAFDLAAKARIPTLRIAGPVGMLCVTIGVLRFEGWTVASISMLVLSLATSVLLLMRFKKDRADKTAT
jgi:hypothetical protein